MICLAGAISVDVLQKLYFFVRTHIKPLPFTHHYLQSTTHIMFGAILICGLLGLSRSFALFRGERWKQTQVFFRLYFQVYGRSGIVVFWQLFNFQGYYAPMEIMMEANKLGTEGQVPREVNINFCVGKEWHRFPGSFFFPSNKWDFFLLPIFVVFHGEQKKLNF